MDFTAAMGALALCFFAFNIGSIAFFRPAGELPLRLKAFLALVPAFQGAVLAGLFLAPPTGWRQQALIVGVGVSSAIFFAALVSAGKQRFGPIFGGKNDDGIAESGIFAVVRHPFYTAYISCYLTVAVAGGLWPITAGALVLVGLYVHAAIAEERALAHGPNAAAYRKYCQGTGRFMPLPRRQRRAVTPVPMALGLDATHTK